MERVLQAFSTLSLPFTNHTIVAVTQISLLVGLISFFIVNAVNFAENRAGLFIDPRAPAASYYLSGPELSMFGLSMVVIKEIETMTAKIPYDLILLGAIVFAFIAYLLMFMVRTSNLMRHVLYLSNQEHGKSLNWGGVFWSNITGVVVVIACAAALFRPGPAPQQPHVAVATGDTLWDSVVNKIR